MTFLKCGITLFYIYVYACAEDVVVTEMVPIILHEVNPAVIPTI